MHRLLLILLLTASTPLAFLAQTESAVEKIYSLKELDRPPSPTKRVAPAYPPALIKEKISGVAIVVFVVSKEGRVIKIDGVNANRDEFAEAAKDAILQWEFKPGKKAGKPVLCRVVQQIEFSPDK